MSIWKTDRHGNEIHLDSATSKREFRLFALIELEDQLELVKALRRDERDRAHRRKLEQIEDRLQDVICEKKWPEE